MSCNLLSSMTTALFRCSQSGSIKMTCFSSNKLPDREGRSHSQQQNRHHSRGTGPQCIIVKEIHSAEEINTLQSSEVKCSAVLYSVVQYIAVKYSVLK